MTQEPTIISYKGFSKDWKCRDYLFEVGKEYEHRGEVKACKSGFHACEYPLDVFGYYPPADSVFAQVEQSGKIDRHNDDSKITSSHIAIKAQISLGDMIKAAIDFTMSRVKDTGAASNSGDYGAASNSGTRGAASNSGYQGAASNSGTRGAASNSGDYGAASNSGTRGAASNSGDYGAASNSGDYGAASNSGYQGAAETTGKDSVAAGFGYQNKARAAHGSWIVLAYRNDDGEIKHLKTAQAGVTEGIKPDCWYMLNEQGEFMESA